MMKDPIYTTRETNSEIKGGERVCIHPSQFGVGDDVSLEWTLILD